MLNRLTVVQWQNYCYAQLNLTVNTALLGFAVQALLQPLLYCCCCSLPRSLIYKNKQLSQGMYVCLCIGNDVLYSLLLLFLFLFLHCLSLLSLCFLLCKKKQFFLQRLVLLCVFFFLPFFGFILLTLTGTQTHLILTAITTTPISV